MGDVAVAVVSWNTRGLLAACLDSLRPDHEAGRAEVWVVDNASSDGSATMVREHYPWVHLIASDRNLGYGPAVNLVARRTSAPWIAAANSDLRFTSGALSELLAAGRDHPGAAALAPRLVLPSGAAQHSVHPFPRLRTSVPFNLGLQRWVPGLGDRLCLERYWDTERERAVDWAHGALLVVRRPAWEAVGGFDDDQWFYAEDLDLCWRLRRAGWSTRYVPAARVHHESSASASAAWGEGREARAQAAAYAWMRERRGATRTIAFAAVNVACMGTKAVVARAARRHWRGAFWARWTRLHTVGLRRDPGALARGPG